MPPEQDIATESVNRLATPTRIPESHGRTDGRTDVEATPVTAHLAVSNAGARIENLEVAPISTALAEYLDQLEQVVSSPRWPIERTGERDYIPWFVRLSVLRRDDFTCRDCRYKSTEGVDLQLDHCLPWSAGGTDDTDNLRILCRRCNEHRSNFRDLVHIERRRPTTWWCFRCWTPDSRYRAEWSDGTDLSSMPRVRDPRVSAYCAWCGRVGLTDLPLTGDLLKLATGRVLPRATKDRREVVPQRPGRDVTEPTEGDTA